MLRKTITVLALAAVPTLLHAQADPDSVKQRNDCRLAAQVLSTGHPATHYSWALDQAWDCPAAGGALAERLRSSASTSDVAVLDALTAPTLKLRDGRIYASALALAADKQATPESRVFAARTLIYSMRPGGGIEYAALLNTNGFCYGGGPSPHQRYTQGDPLPAGYVDEIHALGRRLMSDTTEGAAIRHVGMCLALAQQSLLPQ
jgi:hypothetical protein